MKVIAKGDGGLAVIEHHATDEAVAGRLLHHDIRFGAVLVPKMEELDRCVLPTRLSSQLPKRKRFQKLPQEGSVCHQSLDVGAEEGRGAAAARSSHGRTSSERTRVMSRASRWTIAST